MSHSNTAIGVFDSGVGGLSVLKELMVQFPNESFVYLGDTARLPYGDKSPDTLKAYVQKGLSYLNSKFKLKALVVACNSASSILPELDLPVPTYGVIEAGAKAALKTTNKNIGLWATRATVNSKSYNKALGQKVQLLSVSCPLLVTMAEENLNHPLFNTAFDHYLSLFSIMPDTLILGCTHFPLFENQLQQHLNAKNLKMDLVNGSKELACQLKKELSFQNHPPAPLQIFLTDSNTHFKKLVATFLSKDTSYSIEIVDF